MIAVTWGSEVYMLDDVFGNVQQTKIGDTVGRLFAVGSRSLITVGTDSLNVYTKIDTYLKKCGTVLAMQSTSNIRNISLSPEGKLLVISYTNGDSDVHGTKDGCRYQYKGTFFQNSQQFV